MNKKQIRNNFRTNVFKRDKYLCVICKKPGVDAHHIMDRKLFKDGGYVLDNGATLCSECHVNAENTSLTCDEIRRAANIIKIILPPNLSPDKVYNKWGEEIKIINNFFIHTKN